MRFRNLLVPSTHIGMEIAARIDDTDQVDSTSICAQFTIAYLRISYGHRKENHTRYR